MTRTPWSLIACASTLGVVVLCFLPVTAVPQPQALQADKLFHGLAFFVVAFAWRRAGLGPWQALLLGLLLAAGTEIGQRLLGNGRQGDVADFGADMVGVAVGAVLAARHGLRSRA